jgi:hypothetical protein
MCGMYRPSEKARVELAQRLANKAPFAAVVGIAAITFTGGAAHAVPAAVEHRSAVDVRLQMLSGGTAMHPQPVDRGGGAILGSGARPVELRLDPAYGRSSASLELTVGDGSTV